MLDRSSPPAFNAISEFNLIQPNSQKLGNGIPIHIINIDQQPVVKLELIIPAGQWYEPGVGVSFFTIKMLSEGTRQRSAEYISNHFDKYGAFLELNPGLDHVTITLYTLSKYLDELVPVLAELTYEPNFPANELETLVEVKRQKIKVDQEKSSYVASRKFRELLFGASHPYGVYLNEEHLDQINRDALAEYHAQRIPGHFEILISGSIDSSTIPVIDKYFGKVPAVGHPEEGHIDLDFSPKHQNFDKKNSLQSSIRIGRTLIKRNHPDYIDSLVLNEILGGYFGSRLMRNIREEKGYTYGIGSHVATLIKNGFWVVSTDVKQEFRDDTIAEIFKEAALLTKEPVGSEELNTVKNYMLGSFLSGINTPFAIAEKFKNIHFYELGYDHYHTLFTRIEEITAEEIMALAQKYLQEESMSVVTVG